MTYRGSYVDGGTIRFRFNTWDKTNGAPITLAGTPSLTGYKDGDTTQVATGITLTVDYDGVTGLHSVAIDTTAAAFWAAASEYTITIAAGTVDGVSMVGRVVAEISLTDGGLPTQSKSDVANNALAKAMGAAFGSRDAEGLLKDLVAVVLGRSTGAGTVQEVFKTPDNSATRVTIDNDGTNRTGVTQA